MTSLYPLRFNPILRRYLWGGRKLGEMLGKPIGDGSDYAESWEIVDHAEEQSRVSCGPLQGRNLHYLVERFGPELLGKQASFDRFPLLFKFLDCQRVLSVQVHPNDAQAAMQHVPDLGKTEAWVILHAEPGSVLYAGLKDGIDRAQLERAIAEQRTEACLHHIEARAGDCIYVPAGTVHALGAGLVVAEIQQASNTVYRLYDWNRVGPDGKPRPLHVGQALEVIDFDRGPIEPVRSVSAVSAGGSVTERLVNCDKFILDRIRSQSDVTVGDSERFTLLAVLEGEILVPGDESARPLRAGETVLLPACLGAVKLSVPESVVMLAMYLP